MHFWRAALISLSLTVFSVFTHGSPNQGVILLYHHVSEQTPASTSISPQKFAQHMQYLSQHHQVIPLTQLIEALRSGSSLPDKAVAITFDDGYDNIFDNAHPILKEHGFPYTIFINPALIGNLSQQLSWQQVKQLQQQGVSFANHTNDHRHLLTGSAKSDWLSTTMDDINAAQRLLQQKTGEQNKYLAYPYGEYNQALASEVLSHGYVGFGQHSGAVSAASDFGALPRFPAAGIYANLDTLKNKLNSLDMPVQSLSATDPELEYQQRQPSLTVSVDTTDLRPSQLACYYQGKPMTLSWDEQSFQLSFDQPLPVGRSRINCTAPSIQYPGRFYWFSKPWFVPGKDGQWPD